MFNFLTKRPQILSYGNIDPKYLKENPLKAFIIWFNSLDKFVKTSVIIGFLLIISTPLIATSIFTLKQHAAADNIELENGSISGVASIENDTQASGGKYILFSAPTNTPTPTTTPNSPTQTTTPASQPSNAKFGPQNTPSTDLTLGTKFVSPTGTGTTCNQANPCSLITASTSVVPGDVVFLRGGTYLLNDFVYFNKNTSTTQYITFESYPGEWAVLDGSSLTQAKDYLRVYGNYNKLRNFEVKNMPEQGIMIQGNHNIIEGIYAHNNKLSGINVYSPSSITDGSMGSYNLIQNVKSTDNSDVGLTGGDFNDGGNADGISISGGVNNTIKNILVANNSDDGFDSWRSNGTTVSYSISANNGLGASGNGIGFKLGGIAPSGYTQIDHSLAYNNRTGNFDPNGGENVTMINVTSWSSKDYGIYAYPTTTIKNSISVGSPKGNIVGQNGSTTGTQQNNSWQRNGTPNFISTDPNSADFLKPSPGGGFEDIGAYQP